MQRAGAAGVCGCAAAGAPRGVCARHGLLLLQQRRRRCAGGAQVQHRIISKYLGADSQSNHLSLHPGSTYTFGGLLSSDMSSSQQLLGTYTCFHETCRLWAILVRENVAWWLPGQILICCVQVGSEKGAGARLGRPPREWHRGDPVQPRRCHVHLPAQVCYLMPNCLVPPWPCSLLLYQTDHSVMVSVKQRDAICGV